MSNYSNIKRYSNAFFLNKNWNLSEVIKWHRKSWSILGILIHEFHFVIQTLDLYFLPDLQIAIKKWALEFPILIIQIRASQRYKNCKVFWFNNYNNHRFCESNQLLGWHFLPLSSHFNTSVCCRFNCFHYCVSKSRLL